MSNVYKNAIYKPTTTANTTVYTCNATARAIIQNIQIANESGSKTVQAMFIDSISSNNLDNCICSNYSDLQHCNLANGPIILQEGDALLLDSSVTTSVSGTISIMEVNRGSLTT
jgi:hypothetical protein